MSPGSGLLRRGRPWLSLRACAFALLLPASVAVQGQSLDSTVADVLSAFDRFNEKAERVMKFMPIPIISYSSDVGNVFGLVKFNAFKLVKGPFTKASRLTESVNFSPHGRVNVTVKTDLIFRENKNILVSSFNYKVYPEYVVGVGNDHLLRTPDQIVTSRIKYYASLIHQIRKFTYAGLAVDASYFYNVQLDSTSTVAASAPLGIDGGTSIGLGPVLTFDTRDSRYTPRRGVLVMTSYLTYPKAIGSTYSYGRYDMDLRMFLAPKYRHVVAVQLAGSVMHGDVPFYDLAKLGGGNRMRGYSEGLLRDKVLIDGQVEYRLPIWKVFGVVGWVGAGRVAPDIAHLSLNGLYPSYGAGMRIRVDSDNDINLRFDVGFGKGSLQGFYLNFGEVF